MDADPCPHVVIVGAGHAAMVALDELAGRIAGVRITLISPGGSAHYSGMVPGWIAGLYRDDEMIVPLAPFAARVGVAVVDDAVRGLDEGPDGLSVLLASGRRLAGDILVVNAGSVTARPGLLADPRIIAAKPFGAMMDGLRPALPAAGSFAVIGAGVAGIEVALALKARRADARVTLVERGATVLCDLPSSFRRRVLDHIERSGVDLRLGAAVEAVEPAALRLSGGSRVPAECALALTGPQAPAWLAATPLRLGADGFIAVDGAMRSLSHPGVLGVGDIATRPDDPRPKAGVFSVRAGPPLARAIVRMARGKAPEPVDLQRRALILLATGGRHAVGTRNGLSAEGRWVWRLKDRFDRDFIGRFMST